MKTGNVFCIFTIFATISLLLTAIPASTALAASMSLSPTSGEIGSTIHVYSYYYTANSTVTIYFGADQAIVGNLINTHVDTYDIVQYATADSSGILNTYITVPSQLNDGTDDEAVTGGTYYVYVTNYGSYYIQAIDDFTVTGVAEIELDPEEGVVGTEVEITGTGFDEEEDITVEYDDDEVDISGDDETDDDGEFICTFIVPESTAGDHTVKVSDESNNEVEAEFTVEPQIILTPDTGALNTTIAIAGTGFDADEDIEITFDGASVTTIPISVESDENGSFDATFKIPASAAGLHTVTAEDESNNDDSANLVIQATASLDKTTGNVNTSVAITGTGFVASQIARVYFDGVNIQTADTIVNPDGSVSTSFSVPAHTAGTFVVRITDGTNIVDMNFTILTSAEISQTSGSVGTEITISGIGFTVGQIVTITYDGTLVPDASTPVNNDGTFSVTFNIPASSGGAHTITASDTVISQQFTFTMESTPPSTVYAHLPLDGSKLADWRFDWSGNRDDTTIEVTDASLPITYHLQIATDSNFTTDSIVFEREALTESEYTLTAEERLPSVSQDTPYYWRVRAVDAAGNTSPWTGAGSFTVGFSFSISRPLLITLLAVGAVLIAVFSFWLGRKTAYY